MYEEKTILKLIKDAECKLTIHTSDMEIDQATVFLVSEKLQEAIVKELKDHGFEDTVDTIDFFNRVGLDEVD